MLHRKVSFDSSGGARLAESLATNESVQTVKNVVVSRSGRFKSRASTWKFERVAFAPVLKHAQIEPVSRYPPLTLPALHAGPGQIHVKLKDDAVVL